MDCVFGIKGKDFVLVCTDGTVAYSVMKITDIEDKIIEFDSNKVLAIAGEAADRNQFGEYISKNLQLIRYKTGSELSIKESANFIRSELAEAIRKGPYQCNCILGGVEKDGQPELYWLDYFGSIQRITKGAHGYAAYFLLGLLDNQWKPNLTKEDGLQLAKHCIAELKQRFLISQNVFFAKIITKNGIETLRL